VTENPLARLPAPCHRAGHGRPVSRPSTRRPLRVRRADGQIS